MAPFDFFDNFFNKINKDFDKFDTYYKTYNYKNNTTLFYTYHDIEHGREVTYYKAEVPMAGFSINEISAKIIGNKISVTGTTTEKIKTREVCNLYDLPGDIDANTITGKFKNGLLILTAQKLSEEKTIIIKITGG